MSLFSVREAVKYPLEQRPCPDVVHNVILLTLNSDEICQLGSDDKPLRYTYLTPITFRFNFFAVS